MTGPKDLLATVLFRLRVLHLLSRRASNHLVVFGYHRFRAAESDGPYPFDDGTVGPTVSEFRRQINWLRHRVRILGEEDLLAVIRDGRDVPVRGAAITFDDAYRDVYTLAFPVLRELSVPALVFVPTGLIDRRRLGWWDLIAYLLKNATVDRVTVHDRGFDLPARTGEAIEYAHELMKSLPAWQTEDFLERLAGGCRADQPGEAVQDSQLMTWDHVRELAGGGIAIGSHTRTHRVLSRLEPDVAREEMEGSRRSLEKWTGRSVASLAYPCGGYEHFDSTTQALARDAGYELAFSFNTGVNRASTLHAFDVKRLDASRSLSRLAAMTVVPEVFAWSIQGRPGRHLQKTTGS